MNPAEFYTRRVAMGWEIGTTAERLGYHRRTIKRWETGEWGIPFDAEEAMEEHWQAWIGELAEEYRAAIRLTRTSEDPAPLQIPRDSEQVAKAAALAVIFQLEKRGFTAEWADGGE